MSSALRSRSGSAPRLPGLPLAVLACGVPALLGGVLHRPVLSVAAALLLLVAWLPSVWARRSAAAALLWLGLATLILVPALIGHAGLALPVLPVVFLAVLSWWFARTLRRGAEPLIVRCIRVIEGDARLALPGVRGYARGVTLYWACVLGALALLSLLLMLFAQPGGWLAAAGVRSPFAISGALLARYPEVGCWAVLALAFAGEYAFRRWHMRGIPHPPLRHFLMRLVQRWPRLVRGEDEAA